MKSKGENRQVYRLTTTKPQIKSVIDRLAPSTIEYLMIHSNCKNSLKYKKLEMFLLKKALNVHFKQYRSHSRYLKGYQKQV